MFYAYEKSYHSLDDLEKAIGLGCLLQIKKNEKD